MLKKINFKFFTFILFSPIFVNLFYNLFFEKKIFKFDIYYFWNVVSIFIMFFNLYLIGRLIKKSLDLPTISFSVCIFLTSFYIFEYTLLPLTKNISFKISATVVVLLWLFYLTFSKKTNSKEIILVLILISLSRVFYTFLVENNILHIGSNFLTQNLDIVNSVNGDEGYFWFPTTATLFDNNYYTANQVSPIGGYGFLIQHITATLHYLFFDLSSFTYFSITKNVFLLLMFLFISEISTSRNLKYFFSCVVLFIIFSSHWFRYMFFDSLLGEGIASYLIGSTICIKYNKKYLYYQIFLLSFLIYSKQFISSIALIFSFYLLFQHRKKMKYYIFTYYHLMLTFLYYFMFKNNIVWSFYLDTTFGNKETTTYPKFINFFNIIKQFSLDRPISYFLAIIILTYIYNIYRKKPILNNAEKIILLNTFLVFFLYIFLWKEVEFESSYRYLLNTFYLIIYFAIKQFETLEKNFY